MTTFTANCTGMRAACQSHLLPAMTAMLALLKTVVATASIGVGTVVANPYGALSVQGGTLVDNTITGLQQNAVIQLGPNLGGMGYSAQIDFQGINVDAGSTLTIRAGAPGQSLLIRNADVSPAVIAGLVRADAATGFPAPRLYVSSPTGITVLPAARVESPSGLTVDALGATETAGQPLVNDGVLDGGNALWLFAAKATGGGEFRGNAIYVSTFGNANNPINGAHYLDNSLQLYPGSGGDVLLTMNDYGTAPQFFNFKVNGNATVAMPSTWPAGLSLPQNNLPVMPGATSTATAGYGGGSMIVQATGSLTLAPNAPDFVFPGGIVFKSGDTMDLAGVLVDNGWTGAGVPMQGVFFEAPLIISSSGAIQVLTNNRNWVNFSTYPQAPVKTWQLSNAAGGTFAFASADSVAPHINTYSTIIAAAAAGQCWTCLVNSTPMNAGGSGSASPPPPPASGAPGAWTQYPISYAAGNEAEYQSWYNLTYDSKRDVFYGVSWMGVISAFSPTSGRWTALSPNIGGGVHNRTTAYDPINDRVWLGTGTGSQLTGVNYFDPVAKTWNSYPMTGALPGNESAMIFDPAGKRFIVFGGWLGLGVKTFSLSPLATTLADAGIGNGPAWDNDARKMTAWRSGLDTQRNRIFYVDTDGSVWFLPLSLSGWVHATPTGAPPPKYTQYVYDAANDAIVGWSASPRVADGDTNTGTTRETWLLPLSTMTWSKGASVAGGQTVPPDTVYVCYAMAYDPVRQQTLLHSLTGTSNFNPTTWAYRFPTGGTSAPGTPPSPPAAAPTATITATPTASDSFKFDGAATAASGLTVTSYAWTFGDGTSGSGASVSHTYTASGTYSPALTVKDSNGSATTVSTTVTANVPVVTPPNTPPPPPPPPPPPTNVPSYTGKITSFALPAISNAPFNSLKGSKHTNMASDGKRIYVSGGDWLHSATDGTWSMSLADGTWRQDVGDPVYPTLPAPHALQDGAGFDWVASRQKFLLWPGSYYAYEPAGTPILEYAKGMWWLDPATNTYQQDLSFFGTYMSSTGSPNGGIFDEVNEHIVEFADSSMGFATRRWDVKNMVRLPDVPFSVALNSPYAAYFTRTKHVKIGRDVYIVGFRTNGNVSSQTPLLLRWNLDSLKMTELTPPPVDGTLMKDLEVRLATSHGKLVWPFMNGPEGTLRGIWIYDPATNGWSVDNQVPSYGNFIGNSVCSLPDGRVCFSGGEFGLQQTHMWFYEVL